MDIRQLQYLVALGRARHFTRAAAACNVTQPTLSGRIRQLEQELGVPIVKRGQRFQGFTEEGERVLLWATRIVEAKDKLIGDLAGMAGTAGGRLILGVIPSALPMIPPLTEAMHAAQPQASFTILSQSSDEILRGLEAFEIDAGVTYLGNEPVPDLLRRPLYTERYRLFLDSAHPLAAQTEIGWADAAAHPLCLLTRTMQNRRIIDATFRQLGCHPVPEVESSSALALIAHIRQRPRLATILPEHFASLLAWGDVLALPLTTPEITHSIGLVALDRDPLPRLVSRLLKAADGIKMP
ncbi:MAG: LysR family transcriptional regulator [Pseudomonadota bacterium]